MNIMIPEERKTLVKNILQSTFGVSDYEDISQLTTGLSSALVFRMIVLGKPYLLKIFSHTEALGDPAHQFNCMKIAAEAGIGPRIWYMNADERILITDFIEAKPFPIAEAREKLAGLLKRLHSLPAFPSRLNYIEFVHGIARKFLEAKILPETLTNEVFNLYAKTNTINLRCNEDLVSCHNDLKPENILFDGDRPWIADWDAAFLNDRYIDLAIVANFVVTNDHEEREYLKNYFGEDANEYQRARFFLMRQVLHMSYFTFFLLLVSRAGKAIDMNLLNTDFRTFHDHMWAGKIDLANDDERQAYAGAHLQQLRHNLRLKRFEEALGIVSK